MFLVPVTRSSSEMLRGFDRLFDDAVDRMFGLAPAEGGATTRSPALDVSETDKQYSVKLDLPGVTREQVKVSIDGRRVSVDAEVRKEEERKEGERVVYRERSLSSFSRSFTLPGEIDQETSSAKLENGVLTLTLGKRAANGGSRQLPIR